MDEDGHIFYVTGMSSGECRRRITEHLRRLPGVQRVRVDLDANEVEVWGDAKPAEVTAAIVAAGYGLSLYPVPEARGTG